MASLFSFPFFKHKGYCYEFYFLDKNNKLKCVEIVDEDLFKEKFDNDFLGIESKEIVDKDVIKYVWSRLFKTEEKYMDSNIYKLKFVKRVKVSWYENDDKS